MENRLLRWFNNLRLQTKFFAILLLALLMVFLGTFLSSRMPYRAYDEQLYTKSVQLLTLFAEEIQTEMASIAEISYYIIGDNVLQSSLTAMRKTQYGSAAWVQSRREVSERVDHFSLMSPYIKSIRLRSLDGALFTRTLRGQPVSLSLFNTLEKQARAAAGRQIWVPDPNTEGSILLARDVREVADLTLNSIGTLAMRIDLDRIVSRRSAALREMEMPLITAIYADGVRLYAGDADIAALEMPEDGFDIVDVGGTRMFCVRYTSSSMGWTYITAVPYGSIMRSISEASRLSLAIALAALVAALLLCSLFIASILRHFKALLQKYDAFAEDTLVLDMDSSPYRMRKDEIGSLHRHFDKMASDYSKMIQDIYVKQQLLLEAQVRQLRAQIQPHFLYNTLESIYCLAASDGNEQIAAMTHALGKMLRATLSDKRDIITIAEDMRIARDYLDIQLIRYGDRLHIHFDVDDQYRSVRIPAMTLQPLVENAVRHAAEEMLEACEIGIHCRRQDGFVELIVSDNGPGMSEDTLEKLESGELQAEGLGVGMRNIHRRLRLAFSDACGLRIVRDEGWTHVIVRLPGEEDPHGEATAGG